MGDKTPEGNFSKGQLWKRFEDARIEEKLKKVPLPTEAELVGNINISSPQKSVESKPKTKESEAKKQRFSILVGEVAHTTVETALLLDINGQQRLRNVRDTQPMVAVPESSAIKGGLTDQALDFLRRDVTAREAYIEGLRREPYKNLFVRLESLEARFISGEVSEGEVRQQIKDIIVAA
jgi:hypothetical protein